MFTEDNFIQLSAIQHYVFCPRQCALIHVDGAWDENVYTVRGSILHEVKYFWGYVRNNPVIQKQMEAVLGAEAVDDALVETHVASCAECARDLATLRQTVPSSSCMSVRGSPSRTTAERPM